MDRNLALEFVRVTEAAALASAAHMGRGDEAVADAAAVSAMYKLFPDIEFNGRLVIGEGHEDSVSMLYAHEALGTGKGPEIEVVVDALESATSCALGGPNAIAAIAIAEQGGFLRCLPDVYMEKIAVGPESKGSVSIEKSPTENLVAIAKATGRGIRDLTAVILDRDRHADLIDEVRESGARIRLIPDGDVAGAIATATSDGADVLFGVGGTPEGVISAAALKCLGGEMQGKLWPRNGSERKAATDAGFDLDRVLHTDDLVRSDDVFFAATGITDGELLRGVRFTAEGAISDSLVMRSKSGTVRRIEATHNIVKLSEFAAVDFT